MHGFDLDSNRTQITENGESVASYTYDPKKLDLLTSVVSMFIDCHRVLTDSLPRPVQFRERLSSFPSARYPGRPLPID